MKEFAVGAEIKAGDMRPIIGDDPSLLLRLRGSSAAIAEKECSLPGVRLSGAQSKLTKQPTIMKGRLSYHLLCEGSRLVIIGE